jgi:hypothetical protein
MYSGKGQGLCFRVTLNWRPDMAGLHGGSFSRWSSRVCLPSIMLEFMQGLSLARKPARGWTRICRWPASGRTCQGEAKAAYAA